MLIKSDRILVGFTKEQLERIIIPALEQWKGPVPKPRTPAEEEYQFGKLNEAERLYQDMAKELS